MAIWRMCRIYKIAIGLRLQGWFKVKTITVARFSFKTNKGECNIKHLICRPRVKTYHIYRFKSVLIRGRKIMMMSRHCRVQKTNTSRSYWPIQYLKSLHQSKTMGPMFRFHLRYLLVKSLSQKPSELWNLKNLTYTQHQYLQLINTYQYL